MKGRWQLQEAKSRFSEVVDETLAHGPQRITRHGEDVVVIVSAKEFARLTRPKGDIVSFFSRSPLAEVDIDLGVGRRLPHQVARQTLVEVAPGSVQGGGVVKLDVSAATVTQATNIQPRCPRPGGTIGDTLQLPTGRQKDASIDCQSGDGDEHR